MESRQTPLVLVFSTSYLPDIGGAELAVSHITKRIEPLDFYIFTSRNSNSRESFSHSRNVTVRRLGAGFAADKWLLPFLGFFAARKIIKRGGKIILWGIMISQGTIAAYFLKKMYPEVPLVVTLQEGDSEEHMSRRRFGLIGYFWRRVLASADGVTAISSYLAKRAELMGFGGDALIIPNGVDERIVSESYEPAYTDDLKNTLKIGLNVPVILTVSRLTEKNGIPELLDGFRRFLEAGNEAVLVIIGTGEDKLAMKKLAGSLGVSGKVRFAGAIPNDDVHRYYRMSDVFIRASRSEGLGTAFLEAMGSCVPVIATPVGGITDFLEDGVTGLFVKPEDAGAICAALQKLLRDEELRKTLAANARELVSRKYLWVDVANSMKNYFGKFL